MVMGHIRERRGKMKDTENLRAKKLHQRQVMVTLKALSQAAP